MAVGTFNFTTGPTTLPDVEVLSYNGCTFSPLFASVVSGAAIKDDANRTVKFMEYTLSVDGYVTAPTGFLEEAARESVKTSCDNLRLLLTAQGGTLVYQGRGCDLVVNAAGGGGVRDVAWGPVPELLEFQPLGGGLSAKCRWQVKVRIPEVTPTRNLRGGGGIGGNDLMRTRRVGGGLAALPLLQFNYETSLTYGEDGYSSMSVRGVLEIALTRTPTQIARNITNTADDARRQIEQRVMAGVDLGRFRVTRRTFNLSRDKRKLEWDFSIEERPYMDMPPGCTIARGTYSVRPARTGPGLCLWLCSLRASYTVRGPQRQSDAGWPRRIAWLSFLNLLRLRMGASVNSPDIPMGAPPATARGQAGVLVPLAGAAGGIAGLGVLAALGLLTQQGNAAAPPNTPARKAWLVDFSFDEGIYLDSKVTSFSATWRLNCMFSHILLASGLWRRLDESATGQNLWAISMRDVQGSQSWLANVADPAADVIVDFGA